MAAASRPNTLEFDFTSAAQLELLGQLQQQGYSLLVFQRVQGGAGEQQPRWLQRSFNDIFGVLTLPYTWQYKLYVRQRLPLTAPGAPAANLQASAAMTEVVEPGTSLVFNQNGTFAPGEQPAPPHCFKLGINAVAGSQPLYVGLAASIDDEPYAPVCVVSTFPGQELIFQPEYTLIVGVARLASPGQPVTLKDFAPGFSFQQSPGARPLQLAVEAGTYAVVGAAGAGGTPVPAEEMCLLATGSLPAPAE